MVKNKNDNFMSNLKSNFEKNYKAVFDSNVDMIPSGLTAFDKFVGGIPLGKMVLIQALEGVGKSSLAVQLAAGAQKLGYPVIYFDTESSMSNQRFKELGFNLKDPNTFYVQPTTLQMIFGMIQNIIKIKESKSKTEDPTIIIWDSLAATPALEEIEKTDIDGVEIGIRARIISQGLRIITSMLTKANISLIVVNQYRVKMNSMSSWGGPQFTTPGGNAPRYHAFYIVELKDGKKFGKDDVGDDFGKLVRVKTLKNKFLPPLVEFSMYYTYTHGFDNIWTAFYTLKNAKIIKASGPWMSLSSYPDKKFHKSGFKSLYLSDKDFAKAVDAELNKLQPSINIMDTEDKDPIEDTENVDNVNEGKTTGDENESNRKQK